MTDVERYITPYVDQLKKSGALTDPAVERALRRVPRHLFVERFFVKAKGEQGVDGPSWIEVEHDREHPQAEHLETIYSNAALITRLDGYLGTSSSSQPGLMSEMLEKLELRPGMKVLEIGAGTGYNAALIAEIVGDPSLVTAIDIQPDVVDQACRSLNRAGYGAVRVLCADGFEGASDRAPFDRIVATVGMPDLSPRWAEQLAPDGFMLIPLRHAGGNPLVRVRHNEGHSDSLCGQIVGFSGFMAVQGALSDPAYYSTSRPADAVEEIARPFGKVKELAKRRLDFWFFMGLRDPRTRIFRWLDVFGLDDRSTNRTARVEQRRTVGHPDVLDTIDALFQEWCELGAPAMRDYQIHFTPVEAPTDHPPSGAQATSWAVTGPYYNRTFCLREDRDRLFMPSSAD